jgi:hypothetical protein
LPRRAGSTCHPDAECDVSRSFDEEEEGDLDDSFTEGLAPIDGAAALPVGDAVEEEEWDEADFDEDFDEDFENEPDEDLEKFEKELDSEKIQSPVDEDDFEDEDF